MAVPARTVDSTDPANLSAEERMAEIGAILASALLRLRRGVVSGLHFPPDSTADSGQNCLDDAAETGLHGHRG